MKRFLVGGCAALLATACAGDPSLYLGGPAGPPVVLELSSQRFVLRAGATATLAGQLRDEVGNAVAGAVTFAPCDSKVSVGGGSSTDAWATTATITASTLGESCITATAASFTETIVVRVVPGTIVIVGPDSVPSGGTASYSLEFRSLDGTLLATDPDFPIPEVVSLNSARMPITAVDPLNYDAAGQAPGSVTLQAATGIEYGSVSGDKRVTIVPGIFGGTLSATTAAQGAPLTVTGVRPWDADVYVTVGGEVAPLWNGLAASPMNDPSGGSVAFTIPWNLAPGDYEVIVFNQGPLQVAELITSGLVTVTAGIQVPNTNPNPGANTPGAAIQSKINLNRPLAFPVVFGGSTHYTFDNRPASGQGNPGEKVVRIRMDWVDSCGQVCDTANDEDFDIEVINGAFTTFLDTEGAGLGVPESTLFNFNDGAFYFVRFRTFSGTGASHVTIEWLGDGALCADEGACVISGEH